MQLTIIKVLPKDYHNEHPIQFSSSDISNDLMESFQNN